MSFEEWWEGNAHVVSQHSLHYAAYAAWYAAWDEGYASGRQVGMQLVGAHGSLMDRLESQSEGAD